MAGEYEVQVENSAAKAIQRLQVHDQVRVLKAVAALSFEPRPNGCTKLSGFDAAYRVRVGNYRIVYIVDDSVRVITVTRVGHRRDVYR
jgi:mRNA interferase RelE/StbE